MINILKTESISRGVMEIALFCISNSSGAYIEVTNIGASVVSVVVPNREGILSNVVLKYNQLADYLTDTFYLGSTVGRFSNRISKAQFSLNGTVCHLDKNDGANTNHGGFSGFNSKIFNYEIKDNSVVFHIESPAGEGGFPGNLKLAVTYSFSENNDVVIQYAALSDKETPVNFTNHTYFNLSGNAIPALDHLLKVHAGNYLETDNEFLPTGRIQDIRYSAFDFTQYADIEKMAASKSDNLVGYNAYFIRNNGVNEPIASVKDTLSGRIVDVYTSMPGVLLYTGDFLSNPFIPFQGLCLEPQYYPNAVNQSHFEVNMLVPNRQKTDTITYSFRCEA